MIISVRITSIKTVTKNRASNWDIKTSYLTEYLLNLTLDVNGMYKVIYDMKGIIMTQKREKYADRNIR